MFCFQARVICLMIVAFVADEIMVSGHASGGDTPTSGGEEVSNEEDLAEDEGGLGSIPGDIFNEGGDVADDTGEDVANEEGDITNKGGSIGNDEGEDVSNIEEDVAKKGGDIGNDEVGEVPKKGGDVAKEGGDVANDKGGDTAGDIANCIPDIQEVERLFKESSDAEENRKAIESNIASKGRSLQANNKRADISLNRQKNQDAVNRAKEFKQLIFQVVTRKLIEEFDLTFTEINKCLPAVPLDGVYSMQAKDECLDIIFHDRCNSGSKYRTADGTCNNLRNPRWGAAGACYRRMLAPRYVGESGFRQSVKGGPLPEPRDISLLVHSHLNRPTTHTSHMYMFFGQLLDHDITQSPSSVTENNEPIRCCNQPAPLHPQCIPISIRPTDPFYAQFGITCINLVRSALCPTCRLGHRQQPNELTAFIDASFVYGNNEKTTANLRTNDGTGRMRFEKTKYGILLPPTPNPINDQCGGNNQTEEACLQRSFIAGDGRVNQQIGLAGLQTIFLREHNRLAYLLKKMNPTWSGDRIFQEARKIVGAEMQVIIHKEYLPVTLGHRAMQKYNLYFNDRGWTKYEDNTNPTLYNEFSTAAFRFGHSLIASIIANTPKNESNQVRYLRDEFFRAFELRGGILSPMMVGLCQAPAQTFDRHMVPDVTNFLFRIRGQSTGLDLASINIQRGRDHGMPTYTDMVYHCFRGEITIANFPDLVRNSLMTEYNAKLLSGIYRSVRDVDLWTGILSETPSNGAVVGQIGTCIMGRQFRNLKFGDRFYFEHGYQAGSFTNQQREELKKMSLAKIICLNTDIFRLPKNAMLFYSKDNPLIICENVKGINLSYWREKRKD